MGTFVLAVGEMGRALASYSRHGCHRIRQRLNSCDWVLDSSLPSLTWNSLLNNNFSATVRDLGILFDQKLSFATRCIVLYLYIYIALLEMHTNQKRFQCETHTLVVIVLINCIRSVGSHVR